MTTYRILSLDGGGIRGVLTARLLENIVKVRPHFLDKVDLFAGTSTGALLAVGLARGLTPAALVSVYCENGPQIFGHNLVHQFGSLGGFVAAKYSTQQRLDGISSAIGTETLADLLPKHVLVSSFMLDSQNKHAPDPSPLRRWKAKFFHNYEGPQSDGHQKALDVVMHSSAAPTYFPIHEGFIDGGVVANNPSLCALAQAIDKNTGNQKITDIVLLSVGTGARPQVMTEENSNWGIAEWNFKLIDLLFDSGSGLADYQCRQLIGDCYRRLNPTLAENIGLDETAKIGDLVQLASDYPLGPTLEWVDKYWQG